MASPLRQSFRRAYTSRPLLDFLAPGWAKSSLLSSSLPKQQQHQRACLSTSSTAGTTLSGDNKAEAMKAKPEPEENLPGGVKPLGKLSESERAYLESALRVNQAGELAATLIYAAQTPPLLQSNPSLRPLMSHMSAQEQSHYKLFNQLLHAHRIRPTALSPLWTVAASALGWSTAALGGEKAAMACTEAVETEIGEHYNSQVRELLGWIRDREARGEEVSEGLRELVDTVRRVRDEELEHLDEAVLGGAKEATAYPVLTAVIRGGCRGAIWLSERV